MSKKNPMKKSLDGRCKFYPKSHKYKVKNKQLVSGTSFIGNFAPKFDTKGLAKKIANGFKYRNRQKELKGLKVTPEEKEKQKVTYWKNEWKQSAIHGTNTHWLMEQEYLDSYSVDNKGRVPENDCGFEERTWAKYRHGAIWLSDYLKKVGEPVGFPEYIVYNEGLGIAGQIDLLVQRNKVVDGEETAGLIYDIIDYKTNKEIKTSGYGDMFFEPIEHLEATTYLKYQLQLSLYAYMLEKEGKEIGDLILLHLKEDKVVEIKIEYVKDLIELLIDYYVNNIKGKENDKK